MDNVDVLSEKERKDKDAWRAEVGTNEASLIMPDAVSHSLAVLQAAHADFLADPDAMSVGALEVALTPPRDRHFQ